MTITNGFRYETTHQLYKTGDIDAPNSIKDNNGEVVLDLCRKCGQAEIELRESCETSLSHCNSRGEK